MDKLRTLKALWNKEKDDYRKTEVGTGVQSFVKKLLESELFNLKEGKLSNKLENRKNEFIYEKKAKENRKADFYIYINSEIAIPVEAECYGNIEAGVKQLLNYQKDFDKRYGILTDGFEWRFYNNNIYKVFTLDDIFNKPDLFITFWKEYIKPEFYYLSFFEKQGQLALVEEVKLQVEDNRQLFFEDITKLIRSFKNKLQIEGYLEGSDKKLKEKRAVELTYAYFIQFILYKTLVDNDFDDFAREFETIVNKIYESLKDKRYKDILGVIEGISARISKNIYRPFIKEQDFIKNKIQELYHSLENNLADVSPWLDIFIFIKKYHFANVRNEIFGYIYENYLKELYEESKKGQYFTDPAVVNFMLEQVGYTPESLKKSYESNPDSLSIIDPSCGSGTFLYSAADSVIKAFQDGNTEEASKTIEEIITKNIFGLDIEEFPLYLAEMNILMRMLPLIINEKYNNPIDKKIKVFKTLDSVSEFMDTALRNTLSDINVEFHKNGGNGVQTSFLTNKLNLGYTSYVRDEGDLKEMKDSLENQPDIPRRRFDFVIGNPPYISYNECAKQKVLIFELMKQGKVKLSDIYGVNLHSRPSNRKKYPPKPNLYSFFLALGLALLKDSGKLCYIIPQTLLTESDYDVLRYHLSEFTTIEKIVTFPNALFTERGVKQKNMISTSSLIIVLQRHTPGEMHEVEVVNYQKSEGLINDVFQNILTKKKIIVKKILQQELRRGVQNWNFIKHDRNFIDFYSRYKNNSDDLSIYYDHILSSRLFKSNFYFDVGFILNKNLITLIPQSAGDFKILDFSDFKGYTKYIPTKYYPDDQLKIKLPKNSQGYKTLAQRYKIVWSKVYSKKFHFTDEKILPSMSFSQFISTDNKEELVYLFSLLDSRVNKLIFNKQFELDNEQYGSFLVITRIKDFIKVPRITENNKYLKKLVIDLTGQLLDLEKPTLADFVDFSEVLQQKFDTVQVEDNSLILKKTGEVVKLPIKHNVSLVRKIIEDNYLPKNLGFEKNTVSLLDLISLPVIDTEKQSKIKSLIDDLVFCLYFNIYIPKEKASSADFVKSACQNNKFYKQVEL